MWKMLRRLKKDESGAVMGEYLILALLLTGVVAAVVIGVRAPLTGTHNAVTDTITTITGSGY